MSAARTRAVRELYRARPKSRVLRVSVVAFALLTLCAWGSGEVALGELFSPQRRANLVRFVTREAWPYVWRSGDEGGLAGWLGGELGRRVIEGAGATFAIAVGAIGLAALFALAVLPFGARTLMRPRPFEGREERASGDAGRPGRWRLISAATRLVFVLLRAIPEYVWAFLFLAMLGASAWPAVVALALHNAGILGRLGADTVEDLDPAPQRALRGLGASRRALFVTAILPAARARFLLYLFYRFETCVREATVLGMLGVVSLGYWIEDARSRQRYDDMLVLVAACIALVVLADVLSHLARAWVRRAP